MIFTVGHYESYASHWRQMGQVFKVGAHSESLAPFEQGYPGGSVWATFAEAAAHLSKHGLDDYAVWPVQADWETQTRPTIVEGGEWHDLLVDSPLLTFSEKPCV